MKKTCKKCGVEKPVSEFYSRADRPTRTPSDYQTNCKPCYNIKKAMNTYNITEEQLNELIKSTTCDICGVEFETRHDLKIDHCHTTGKVRGTLCNTCNCALGWIEKVDLEKHLNYIEKWKSTDLK